MVSRFRVSLVLGLYLISASAEARTSPGASAVDDGAGYKLVIIEQQQNHPLGAGVDTGFGDAVEFSKTYPLIASPLTQDANAFNAEIRTMLPKWWNGPSDNTQKSAPDTDITLVCQPTGEPPPVDGKSPDTGGMLPGVISMACMNDRYRHGALHGGGVIGASTGSSMRGAASRQAMCLPPAQPGKTPSRRCWTPIETPTGRRLSLCDR
ncbi:hypothetical protein GT370_17845 [Acidocella sp. MX-AZ03]|uniref:hypothetical protein n=1 Tax=Acidocella sp. MX-AZ03 TaxID=2697363 RepID=UPI0022DD78EB|nr:hypothetical protein [Acidocella sp. MX-AZ03]WBO58935.1 hypothetical protein GT370_17845 [Acidocella sp. MX-AZ03]